MKTEDEKSLLKKATPKKIGLILLGILIFPTIVTATDVFGKRVTMWLIHNYYEEECYEYEACVLLDYRTPTCRSWIEPPGEWEYRDAECIKWHLVRKIEKYELIKALEKFRVDVEYIMINQTE